MKGKNRAVSSKPGTAASVRATISFPAQLYQTLEGIAKQKKVSLAWVVREATDRRQVALVGGKTKWNRTRR
jgi:hypothetical protein